MCHRLGLIDIINENIPCNTDIDIGTLVVGMVCDTLSGRSPLYQVEDFIAEQDTELLFGARVDSRRFNDDALGNALDRIHKKGTLKLFTEVSLKAASVFNLDTGTVSYDTTSVNVWGDYAGSRPGAGEPHITHGHSKDKRGDLKQFMVSMLCVEGNASDNKLDNTFLKKPSRIDALAFILLLSLMIWNLIQRTLRSSAEVKRGLLEDLNRRPTKRPTGYLFMRQLSGIIVLMHGNRRMLSRDGIKPRGMNYLRALGFDEEIYTTPPPPSKTLRRPLGL